LEKCSSRGSLPCVKSSSAARLGEVVLLPQSLVCSPAIPARPCASIPAQNTSELALPFSVSRFVFRVFPAFRAASSEHPVRKIPRNRTKMQKSPVLVRLVRKFVRKFHHPNTPFGKSRLLSALAPSSSLVTDLSSKLQLRNRAPRGISGPKFRRLLQIPTPKNCENLYCNPAESCFFARIFSHRFRRFTQIPTRKKSV